MGREVNLTSMALGIYRHFGGKKTALEPHLWLLSW